MLASVGRSERINSCASDVCSYHSSFLLSWQRAPHPLRTSLAEVRDAGAALLCFEPRPLPPL